MPFRIPKLMMRLVTAIAGWLMVVSLAGLALGHGTPLHLDGTSGALVASGGLALAGGYAGMAFDPSDEAGLDFPGATVRTDFPGFDVTGVAEGATLQLQLIGRLDHSREGAPQRWLWFWDPSTELVEVAAGDPDFQFRRKDLLGSLSFDQFSAPAETLLAVTESLTPDSHQHYLRYELDNSPAAAFGVYGAFVRALSPGFEPSPPLLLAFGYGVNAEEYAMGAATINAAAGLAGDFDADGAVDGDDFLVWQNSTGSTAERAADGSLNGVVDEDDLAIWQAQFGQRVVYPPALPFPLRAVPEPHVAAGALLAMVAVLARTASASLRRQKRKRG
jgi:hypothetical protein